jgi:hypothetical protein
MNKYAIGSRERERERNEILKQLNEILEGVRCLG